MMATTGVEEEEEVERSSSNWLVEGRCLETGWFVKSIKAKVW